MPVLSFNMPVFYWFIFGAFLSVSTASAQSLHFTFEGDSTTVPYLQDSLRGISGIEFVPASGEWHFVSDRGPHFVLTNLRTLRDFGDASHLTTLQRTPYWFESIRFDASGDVFFFADEYRQVTSVSVGRRSTNEQRVLLKVPLPADNKGIEGLAITPAGALWVAPEAGWEGEASLSRDTITFFRYRSPLSADPKVERFRYPIKRCLFAQKEERYNGISEILAVDETRLLVLERCYDASPSQRRVTANLFLATVDSVTHTLTKTLAFDFNSQFPGPVCNLEGMTWLDAQQQTLVLMADDNFSSGKTQRNQLIFLKRRE